ncbi:competence protein CoiA-like protein [Nocardia tenerifensis]|uniref:Competence protein CoiA-like protein n=1 Tax=Nocardia tenerifensis TaxID=228006 RepID=A0A318JUI1_9NOCA|nr:competence protein CoiA family protein [Nocardia tenerifensis]PXX60404.1 competence protein CoiA-like protein [Nocardia tenerifensis]
MRSYDNLTVALDLARHEYLCAPTDPADPRMAEVRAKSYAGDQTLVCALCYAGIGAPPASRAAAVVKGRVGGARRPHFAHPPGQGPAGGQHDPDSEWHLMSKMSLAAWARTQPGVVDVGTEVWLPNRRRRADVRVRFDDGSQVGLEAQGYRMPDADWIRRHRDYAREGVVDVWLWHPQSPTAWIVLGSAEPAQQLWTLDPWKEVVTVMVGAPHRHQFGASDHDIDMRVQHLPPCVGDELVAHQYPLTQLELTPHGISIPAELQSQLAGQQEQQRRHIQTVEKVLDRLRSRQRRPTSTPQAPASTPPTVQATDREKPCAAQNIFDTAAQKHLKWIALQNALHAAGHIIDYRDAPSLPLPRTKPRPAHCTGCRQAFPAELDPRTVQRCQPSKSVG